MDVVFDIDGTLADATHRLHFINDMQHWAQPEGKLPRPDWESFLADEHVGKDEPIPQTWKLMHLLLKEGNTRVIFITGRKESTRAMTEKWLTTKCKVRAPAVSYMELRAWPNSPCPRVYMRADGDRRPSYVSKEENLQRARADGFNPTLVFEDRADDTAMWRRNGLLCCQVAEGNF